LNLVSTSIK